MNYLNHKKVRGFTLVELIISLAILGILAVFAIPAYGDYTKRTKISEALVLTAAHKQAISKYFVLHNKFIDGNPTFGVGFNNQYGLKNAENYNTEIVKDIWVAPQGIIIVTFNEKLLGDEALLSLIPTVTNGIINWKCDANPYGAKGISSRYLPSSCVGQD